MKNIDGFVGQAARVIAEHAGFPLIDLQCHDDERLSLSMHRRRWRVGWLMAARVFACTTAVGLLSGNSRALSQIGSEISATLQAYLNISIASKIQAFVPLTDASTKYLIGGASVVLLTLIGYSVLYGAWCFWNRADTKAIFARAEYELWPFWLFACLGVFLLNIALFGRFGWLTALVQGDDKLFSRVLSPPIAVAFGIFSCLTLCSFVVAAFQQMKAAGFMSLLRALRSSWTQLQGQSCLIIGQSSSSVS